VDLHSGGSPVERHGIYERRAPPAWCGSAEDGMGRLRSSGRNGGRMSLASEQPPPRRGQEEKIGGIGWAGEGRRGIWGFLESFRSDPTNAGAFSELGFFFGISSVLIIAFTFSWAGRFTSRSRRVQRVLGQ
jgi:hypothetical protein